jgi:tetratricopeptide (TPR) repeat protein
LLDSINAARADIKRRRANLAAFTVEYLSWQSEEPVDPAPEAPYKAALRVLRLMLGMKEADLAAGDYFSHGKQWLSNKEYDKAIQDFDESIRLNPRDEIAYVFRGRAWSAKNEYLKAIKDFEHAIRLDPRSAYGYGTWAWLLATCPGEKVRDGNRAIQMATKACEITDWQSGWVLNILAAAYAEAGQFDEAVRYQTKALERPAYRVAARDEFRQHLELYKNKQPLRQTM